MTVDTSTEVSTGNDDLSGYDDYWGVNVTEKHYLPDGKQYFVISVMTEGQRSKYQHETNQDLTVNRDGGAKIKLDPAKERHALINAAVVDAHMVYKGKIRQFDREFLRNWLEFADPKIVDDLEFAIRKFNPWLQSDMSIEEIDKEIDRLKELRETVEKREKGN